MEKECKKISDGAKKIIIILLISIGAILFGVSAGNYFLPKSTELILEDSTQINKVSEYQKEIPAEIVSSPSVKIVSTSTKKEIIVPERVFLIINFGEGGKIMKAEAEFKDGMAVFDLLQKGAEEQGVILETKNYSLGIFIQKIGDKKNGSNNKYWEYYVDGKFALVAADKFKLKAGDKVEWKFEKPLF